MSNKESNLKTDMEFRAYGSFGKIKENQMVYDWQDSQFIEYVGFNGGGYFEVMRFSGLIDKNGKKIYEGDRVKHFGSEKMKHEVVFKYGAFGYMGNLMEDDFISYNQNWFNLKGSSEKMQLNEVEVIGNIYENK